MAINVSLQKRNLFISKEINYAVNNWAFIDMQNLHLCSKERGLKINWKKFRQYLSNTYQVSKAVIFMGYIKEMTFLYRRLQQAGFTLEFRPVRRLKDGTIDGGNVDADLASYVMDYKSEYSKAVIIADDADYCRTIQSLNRQHKLKLIISSHIMKNTSELIKQIVRRDQIVSIHTLRNQIA
jgi:hypothetical protein